MFLNFTLNSEAGIFHHQVYPKTESGRLFYIFFSIFGITLMMTLLKSLGDILSKANKKLYSTIRSYFEYCSKVRGDFWCTIS